MQTVLEDQETLRNGEVRRFRTTGLVFVQIFAPRTAGDAQAKSDILAENVRNSFRMRAVNDNLEFTRATIDDNVRVETDWINVVVSSRFEYRQFL